MFAHTHADIPIELCNLLDQYLENKATGNPMISQSNPDETEGQDTIESVKRPMFDRQYTGNQYVVDILAGHPQRAYNCFRLSPYVFGKLKELLLSRELLVDTRNINVDEQIGIFLRGVAHAHSFRQLCEFFQHSLETISRNYNKVLKAIVSLADEFIKLPRHQGEECHTFIRHSRQFYPFFENALGAIDGTHIPMVVNRDAQNRYRNRKGFTSQNVMAAVSFDRQFVYIAAGWEGSAADMRVLRWAVEEDDFVVPQAKYYLVDSGYANTSKFLAPFRGNRYHLADYQGGRRQRYAGPREIYNHRHAQLRNVVERTFGIWKERFQILTNMRKFPIDVQTDIVIACAVLHNFIGRTTDTDHFFTMSQTEMEHDSQYGEVPGCDEDPGVHASVGERLTGDTMRNAIATTLWEHNVNRQRGH